MGPADVIVEEMASPDAFAQASILATNKKSGSKSSHFFKTELSSGLPMSHSGDTIKSQSGLKIPPSPTTKVYRPSIDRLSSYHIAAQNHGGPGLTKSLLEQHEAL